MNQRECHDLTSLDSTPEAEHADACAARPAGGGDSARRFSRASPRTPPRVDVFGCAIDAVDMDASVQRCEELIAARGYGQHMAMNTAKLVSLQDDPELRSIVARCALVNADGAGVVLASRLLGRPVPARVPGIDLMHRLLAIAPERGYRVFILGARPRVLERAVERLRAAYPGLDIAGYRDGYFDDAEAAAVCEQIRQARADILLVGMSSPRKEYFLGRYGAETQVPFVMGVGGALDVVAGVRRRAPVLLQRAGLEWMFRLLQEPRRMWRRYAETNTRLALMLARYQLSELRMQRRRQQAG